MKAKTKTLFIRTLFLFILMLGSVLLLPGSAHAYNTEQIDSPYRILCISSYNYSYPTVPDQLDGLDSGLGETSVDIDFEFMDAKNYFRAEDIRKFHDYISYKLSRTNGYDLVVVCDDTALHFAMNYYDELFKDTPVVFMGINNIRDAKTAAAHENFTGIAESLDFRSNLELGEKLFPDRDKMVVIVDDTSTAQGEYVELLKYLETEDPDRVYSVINSSYYSREGLKREISRIDDESFILFLDLLEDGEGNNYTLETGTRLISENAPTVPIWRLSIANLENGVLGGVSYSYFNAGRRAGEMAARILNGKDPDDIDLFTENVTHTYFEQGQMDKFGLKPHDLPKDATILNQHQTLLLFYQQNMTILNLIGLIIVLLIVIITILIFSNRRREKLINQDFLTQMPNRTYITARLAAATESSNPFGVLMMDVDHFKTINDTLGHLVGDELLVSVADRLKSFPAKDVVFARIGGDEFMGLIIDANKEKAERLCQEVVSKMQKDFPVSTGNIHITVSIGAAIYPEDTPQQSLVQNYADAALYEVKENGRDGYELFRPELMKHTTREENA